MVKIGFLALSAIFVASATVAGASLTHVFSEKQSDDELITGSIASKERSGYYIDVYKLNHALNKD